MVMAVHHGPARHSHAHAPQPSDAGARAVLVFLRSVAGKHHYLAGVVLRAPQLSTFIRARTRRQLLYRPTEGPRAGHRRSCRLRVLGPRNLDHAPAIPDMRSEEHTSELQSLMRSAYAVFCLKKHKKLYN